MMTEDGKRTTSAPVQGYSRLQILLHWAIAGLVLAQLVVNEEVRLAFAARLSGGSDWPLGAIFHITAGLTLLALMGVRIALRLIRGAVPPPKGGHPLIQLAGEWAHRGLYLLLVAMALSGAGAWFLRSETAAMVHEIGRLALIALILAHILGALVEHFVIGNRVIQRMLRADAAEVTPHPRPSPASATHGAAATGPAPPERLP